MSAEHLPKWCGSETFSPSVPCQECGVRLSRVIDSRHVGDKTRRRRVCKNGHRFTTYEQGLGIWSDYMI